MVPFTAQITTWVSGESETPPKPLTLIKINVLLTRQRCMVPYRTLVRFATECCGYRRTMTTVRVADGDPGVECQVDFGYLGLLDDAATGKRHKMFALVFTAAYSRHTFV